MSKVHSKPIVILVAEDDDEDQMLLQEAMEEHKLSNTLKFVSDGEELLDYLKNRGKYTNKDTYPSPGLILLDLNMPRKDGREALAEIKADKQLKLIPVVILTTSKAEEDIIRSYQLGVNSFITKPVTFEQLVDVSGAIGKYWFEIVELPGRQME
ncbi:MAG: response regulator [Bacteroidota bacterium]